LKSNARYSLLEVSLQTGRKNQIRVHLQDIGHSIAGDKKYGAATNPLAVSGFMQGYWNFSTRQPDNACILKHRSRQFLEKLFE